MSRPMAAVSAGVYGWPVEDAVRQALTALRTAATAVIVARLVLFGSPTFAAARRVLADLGGKGLS
jgi:O-acetyl-ADP-ribose deacetylase